MKEIFDIFGIDTRLLLIQAFNFGVLLVALWYFLYRPLIGMLEKRQKVIEEGVKDAQAAKEEREKILDERETIVTDATHEAGVIIDRAKERAAEKEALLVQQAQERGDRIVAEVKALSEEERRKARESSKEEVASMVVLGVEKVLREKA